MGTPATGSLYERKDGWHARLTVAPKRRRSFHLAACPTRDAAEERVAILAAIVARLSGHVRLEAILELVAKARPGRDLDTLLRHVSATERGEWAAAPEPGMTFRQVAEQWASGEIARRFPDRVTIKTNAWKDVGLLNKHVYPIVGDVPIASFTIDHADAVLQALPIDYASGSRKQVAMLVSRVLNLAAFPLKLIAASPLPKGWLPRRGPGKALSYLYPDEDARLLRCDHVPLCFRVYYGVMAREGMRPSEVEALLWSDVDLERGAITLDVNKTDDPRAWALSPGVARALSAWKRIQRREYGECDSVFVDDDGDPISALHHKHRAESFRAHLLLAGVDRPALHAESDERRPIRAHDLRATFITIALANGRNEAWVADRTGHRSSNMINRYRRAARTVAELNLGDLAPLDEAIPEFRPRRRQVKAGGTAGGTAGGIGAVRRVESPGTKHLLLPRRNDALDASRGTAGGSIQRAPPAANAGNLAGEMRASGTGRGSWMQSVPPGRGARAASRRVPDPSSLVGLRPYRVPLPWDEIAVARRLLVALQVGDRRAARAAREALVELDVEAGEKSKRTA